MDLDTYRAELEASGLSESDLADDPMVQFEAWLVEARRVGVHEPEAMIISTVGAGAVPSSRHVLLRDLNGGFTFFTNYNSQKAKELAEHPDAALCFPWNILARQVRVVGRAERASAEVSDAYFATRPRNSQLGGWASAQSEVLASREELEASLAAAEERFAGREVPRPPNWGGFRIVPYEFEFWQARPFRLHDRFRYRLDDRGDWVIERLWP
jgi:pyridoxamine 5'-phosphate oxidase